MNTTNLSKINLQQAPLGNLRDALIVRRLRNSCCEYLTNFQQTIGVWKQIRWYFRNYVSDSRTGNYRIYIFRDPDGQPVGYGAIQLANDQLLISVCLDTVFRGRGFGTQILEALIQIGKQEKRDLITEIWETNHASRAMVTKCGFQLVSRRLHHGQELLIYHLSATEQ